MKVIMVSTSMDVMGGIASVVSEYYKAGLHEKVDLIKIDTHIDGTKYDKLVMMVLSIAVFMLKLAFMKDVRLIHVHVASRASFWRKSIFLIIGKIIFHKHVIMHMHGAEFKTFFNIECGALRKKFIRYILKKADMLLVLSQSWKKDMEELLGGGQLHVLYNPVALSRERRRNDFDNRLLFMGRYGERKGIYDLLEVIAQIPKEKIYLECHGDGDLKKVKTIVKEKNIANVEIGGWISGDEKDKLLDKSDILILPSYNEGLPMSVLEAQSYGLPVISTNVGGIPEIIEDGVNGFLIQPGDKEALRAKIKILLNDKELMKTMSDNAIRIVKEKFESGKVMRDLLNIYRDLQGRQ